jgi:hypothetical protein
MSKHPNRIGAIVLSALVVAALLFSTALAAFAVSPRTMDARGIATTSHGLQALSHPAAQCGQVPVPLASASSYAVLAGSTITSTGGTALTGDLGLSPGSAITGFPPGTVTGLQNVDNLAAKGAEANLTTAYANATPASRANCPVTLTNGENLAGLTLAPGLYWSAKTLNIEGGALTLSGGGNPNSVFVFQLGSAFTTTSGAKVILTNGAQAGNVFWQVGSSATIGTTSTVQGTILAADSISLLTGSTLDGRALAKTGEVSLQGATVVVPTVTTSTTYAVTFTASGLPGNTNWVATVAGASASSLSNTVEFQVANGSWAFTAGTSAAFAASPSSGTLTVNGGPASKSIAFSGSGGPGAYAVTFTSSGLASGTSWSVSLNGVPQTSTTTTASFTVGNGTYSYVPGSVAGYTADPMSGNLVVNGAAVGETLVFTAGGPGTYNVTFTEAGLASGTAWTVTLNGVLRTSSTPTVVFNASNGTNAFSVGAISGSSSTPTFGNVTVSGADMGQSISFAGNGASSGGITSLDWAIIALVVVAAVVIAGALLLRRRAKPS